MTDDSRASESRLCLYAEAGYSMPEDVLANARHTARDFLFEIDRVMGWRRASKTAPGASKYEALVAWKGYEDSSATWKNLEELYLEAKEVVDEMFSSEWDGNKISKALRKEYERLQDEHA